MYTSVHVILGDISCEQILLSDTFGVFEERMVYILGFLRPLKGVDFSL